MTEAMPIDVSSKVISNTKPATPGAPGSTVAPKPADKPGDPPPAPGSKTFLGWVARSFSRKQLAVAAAAICSLAAGIAAVRLIWPEEPPPSATAALVAELPDSGPAAPVTPPRTGPTLTIEPPKPAEFIPPASLPMPPAAPSTTTRTIPAPSGLETLPAIPVPGATSSGPVSSAGPLAPVAPSSPAISAPSSLIPDVVPAGGTDNKPPAAPSSLPAIPATPSSSLPATPSSSLPAAPTSGPLLPTLPGTPSIAPSGSPEPKAPIVGRPPESLVPPVDGAPKIPAAPAEPSPKLPAVPGMGGARTGGEKMEFVKPAESGSAAPAAATRPPTTSYDVDIYHPKPNDSWEAISREYYSDPRYAGALRAYNQNRALAPGREVEVPPLHILRRMSPQPVPIAGSPPGRVVPPAGDAWSAAGVGTVSARTYRVPPGDGMSLPAVAKLVLGNDQRWQELYQLNPDVNPSKVTAGTELKLPGDARVQ